MHYSLGCGSAATLRATCSRSARLTCFFTSATVIGITRTAMLLTIMMQCKLDILTQLIKTQKARRRWAVTQGFRLRFPAWRKLAELTERISVAECEAGQACALSAEQARCSRTSLTERIESPSCFLDAVRSDGSFQGVLFARQPVLKAACCHTILFTMTSIALLHHLSRWPSTRRQSTQSRHSLQ